MLNDVNSLFWVKFLVPACFAAIACFTDVKERKIPNRLSVTMAVSGLVFAALTGGWGGILTSVGGFATGFAILFILYAIGGGGAGDVKFMAAVGSWLGAYHLLFVFVLSAIFLGVFSMMLLVYRQIAIRPKADSGTDASTNAAAQGSAFRLRLPYAVPVTAAILFRFLWLLLIGRT